MSLLNIHQTGRLGRCNTYVPWVYAIVLMVGLGCNQQIYTFGGPGHGTSFILPNHAAMNPDPIVQSWAAYSLSRGTCQMLKSPSEPSRYSAFECELRSREVLVERWSTRDSVPGAKERAEARAARDSKGAASGRDEYLDLLVEIEQAGFLGEYVWHYLHEGGWIRPDWLRLAEFQSWRSQHLRWHRPKTRIIGYWSRPNEDATSTPQP